MEMPKLPLRFHEREIQRETNQEIFNRMSEEEEKLWKNEAFKISIKELIDEGVKPKFKEIDLRIKAKISALETEYLPIFFKMGNGH